MIAMVATALLILPRRHWGALHMLRGILGIGALFAAMMALGHALPDWGTVGGGEPAGAVEHYFRMVNTGRALGAAMIAVFGFFLLFWPPKRGASGIHYRGDKTAPAVQSN